MNSIIRFMILIVIFAGILAIIILPNRKEQKFKNLYYEENAKGFDLILEIKKKVFNELDTLKKNKP